jgi:hypothetical protein
MAQPDLTPTDERRLIEVLMAHEALPGHLVCEACRLPDPCPANNDARRQLVDSGIDLDLVMTIWS